MQYPLLNNNKTHKSGYTLIEVLVYVLVFTIIIGGIAALVLGVYRHKTIIEDRVNVNEDLRLLSKSIRDDMFLGNDISVVGNTITIIRPAANDIAYYESNNRVYRQEGAALPIAVTAVSTDVRQFTIEDLSSPTAAKTVRITFELTNYPRGTMKPEISQLVSTTFSLKFI